MYFAISFVLMCVFALLMPTDESTVAVPTETPAPEAVSSSYEEAEPTPVPTVEPTPEPTSEPDVNGMDGEGTDVSNKENVDAVVTLVKGVLDENYGENYSMDYDENGVTINVWYDGIALEVTMAAAGYDEYQEEWMEVVDAMKKQTESFAGVFEAAGIDDMPVMFNILNDQNKDNTLLSVLNGVVIYDAVQDAQS